MAGIKVFFSYSREDERLRDELAKHLRILEREKVIESWHDRQILAGSPWEKQIDDHLRQAQIILMLVSPDFLASDYCWDVEIKLAMERHDRKDATVVPVILRPCDWTSSPLGTLQAVPKNAKPVTTWDNPDEAFLSIVRSIRELVERFDRPVALVDGSKPFVPKKPPSSEKERGKSGRKKIIVALISIIGVIGAAIVGIKLIPFSRQDTGAGGNQTRMPSPAPPPRPIIRAHIQTWTGWTTNPKTQCTFRALRSANISPDYNMQEPISNRTSHTIFTSPGNDIAAEEIEKLLNLCNLGRIAHEKYSKLKQDEALILILDK
jgi:hypothetical protein